MNWKKLIIVVVFVLLLVAWVVPVDAAPNKEKPHHHPGCVCKHCREEPPVVEYPGLSGRDSQGSWIETRIAREQLHYIFEEDIEDEDQEQ